MSKHDFTLDSTNGDTEAFFRNVLPEWIHKALQHRHRDWVREEMLTGADFDIRDTGTDQLGVRPNHKEILLFTVHAHVPVDAMRGAPDHKAGEALLRAGPDVIQWLLDAPLVHARYWIVTGPYELRGTEEEIKAEEDSMLRQTEAREDEEELAISPPAVPKAEVRTTLVQTVNIFVDATEAFVAAFRRNVPPPEVALVH
ncbi:MAG TPA: hypothetical protein VFB30_05415 [Spirochaetia bacterium]|nr:hypothetical protein [Spirochaetia bacterium]